MGTDTVVAVHAGAPSMIFLGYTQILEDVPARAMAMGTGAGSLLEPQYHAQGQHGQNKGRHP